MGMVKLMDDSDNGDTGANHYNFTIAASPDEITPQIVQGNVDIAAVPSIWRQYCIRRHRRM